jgi:hypothetical protein
VWNLVGYLGCDCDGYTIREIDAMAWGKAYREWEHTSALQAAVLNCFRGKDSPVIQPSQLHPMIRSKASGRGLVLDGATVRAMGKQLRK